MKKVRFEEGKGLMCVTHGEERIILEYNLEVVKAEKYTSYPAKTAIRADYTIRLSGKDGTTLKEQKVTDLKRLYLFDWFGIADAQLSNQDKNLIYQKLQYDVEELKRAKENYVEKTVIEKGFHEQLRLLAMGDRVIGGGEKINAVISDPLPLKDISKWSEVYSSAEYEKYLKLWPEVTVPLFYASTMQVIKHLISEKIRRSLVVLKGPSGHLKTTLVNIYCLLLRDDELQKSTIRGSLSIRRICERVDSLKGLAYLLDDVHPVSTYQSREQQKDRLDVVVRHVTTNKDTAEVFVTAENIKALGSYSSLDRMHIIEVPQLKDEEMKRIKKQLGKLEAEQMAFFVVQLARQIIEDWDDAKEFAEDYLEKELPFETDNVSRVSTYVKQLLLAEELCRKYMFHGNEELSCRSMLVKVLEKNYHSQMKYLDVLKGEEKEPDYAAEVCGLVLNELAKLDTEEDTMIFMSEEEYIMADGPKFWFIKDHWGDHLVVTKENLQQALMTRMGKVVQMKKVTSDLQTSGILVTYPSGGSTVKIKGLPRHLQISLVALQMYANGQDKQFFK